MRGRLAFLPTVAAVCLCWLPAGAAAQRVDIQERVEYYDIEGRTPEQLLREMQKKGPAPMFGGPRYFARAETYFKWHVYPKPVDDRCELESFEVYIDVVFIMPHWIDQDRSRRSLAAYWEQFVQSLWEHEKGHADIALATGVEIAETIVAIAPQNSCELLADKSRDAVKMVLNKERDAQRDYDRITQHGKSQGAYFNVADAKGRRRRG